jgi:hypothetical protein
MCNQYQLRLEPSDSGSNLTDLMQFQTSHMYILGYIALKTFSFASRMIQSLSLGEQG